MFKFLKKIFTKKPTCIKYDEFTVKYIISSILSSTIDRRVVSLILEKEIKPIVGREIINDIYEQINYDDKIVDDWNLNKWIGVLNKRQLEVEKYEK